MNVFLLRHGIAVDRGTPGCDRDADRPLTLKGRGRLRGVADAMKKLDLSFDIILSSPFVRARQTAEIVAEAFKLKKRLAFSDDLTTIGNPHGLIEYLINLRPSPESVLLVGHEPYLSRLISVLISGSPGLPLVMKKGGLCKITVELLRFGRCASLDWLLTPKQMELMT